MGGCPAWAAVFYLLTVLLNKLLTPLIRLLARRFAKNSHMFDGAVLPTPVRLLILAFGIRWSMSSLPIPLLARQFWSNLAVRPHRFVGTVWLLMLFTAEIERGRPPALPAMEHVPLSRPSCGCVAGWWDILVIFVGLLAVVRHFGIDPTPALAGLGVGGIAVALAAQSAREHHRRRARSSSIRRCASAIFSRWETSRALSITSACARPVSARSIAPS